MTSVPFDPGMSSDTERAHHAAQTEGNPVLAFSGPSTPYIDYQSIDVLLSLQNPRSGAPSELTFYILGQVKELLFRLVYEELVQVRSLLDADQVHDTVWVLRRTCRVVELLTHSWNVLSTITPNEFNAFRDHLGQASGVQSYMYRMVKYGLGNKVAALTCPHRNVPHVHTQVQEALHAPSVYDAALSFHALSGIPRGRAGVAGRLPERCHANPVYALAEALMDVAEGFSRWRSLHLLTVERIIGTKPGTGGTYGVAWLRHINEHRFFPELWTVRGLL